MSSDDGSESHAVLSSKRMVGDEGVKASVVSGWQVLLAHNLDVHLQVAHARLKPFHPAEVTAFPYKLIDLILMDKALKPRHQKVRHVTSAAPHLVGKNAVYVDCVFCYLTHYFCT